MIELPEKVLLEIKQHAAQEFPRESCGVVIVVKGKYKYIPCMNLAPTKEHFILSPDDWVRAEDEGTPVLIVHSHPGVSPKPSQADLVGCERSKLPWLIVNHPVGNMYQFEPTGYQLDLIGRVFQHGVVDCYTFIKDYYKQKLDIELPDFYRANDWWAKGENLYLDNFSKAGFSEVTEMKPHDVLLFQVAAPVPNHGAIWVGDGTIMHHQVGRLSSRDVFGGWYSKCLTNILRHKDFL